ncbi:MAG TPA: lamin tail domain-containing protein [Bacilli bacterium]|nr:lamin tail domain-containing protein [Bacilli bacterium]
MKSKNVRVFAFSLLATALVIGTGSYNLNGVNTAHAASNVVINEVMYSPTSGGEWVELYNPTSYSISLSGLLLSDNEGYDTNEGEYWFPSGASIPAHGYVTVGASNSSASYKWSSGGPALSNSGDGVYLVSDSNRSGTWSSGEVIDGFEFSSGWGASGNGYSLERKSADYSSTSSSTWAQSSAYGGTPNGLNSVSGGSGGGSTGNKTVMFDNAHCETCGNSDWVINGAYSDFADALKNQGYTVVENKSTITSSVLSGVDVLILPEPNSNFSSSEKSAINDFVLNKGKGLYIISDHAQSDRNSDGWDSVEIFNGYTLGNYSSTNEWIGKNFGFRVDEVDYTQEPITDIRSHAITSGVSSLAVWNGATFRITNSSYAKGVAYLSGHADPYVVASQLPSGGRVSAIGDSSPYNDGSGLTSVANYNSWPQYSISKLAVNTVKWLAKDL